MHNTDIFTLLHLYLCFTVFFFHILLFFSHISSFFLFSFVIDDRYPIFTTGFGQGSSSGTLELLIVQQFSPGVRTTVELMSHSILKDTGTALVSQGITYFLAPSPRARFRLFRERYPPPCTV
jgi:hypothetical protein